jgi:cyclopropane fatty-acyl-phospholipid synthase-like methyltransferase
MDIYHPLYFSFFDMHAINNVKEYYDTTLVHYIKWWGLKKNLSLHYGIWDEDTRNFEESLINTNRVLCRAGRISEQDRVLDAGCGVGGAAMFLAQEKNAEVVGISLSQKQIDIANDIAVKKNLTERTSFLVMDYSNTDFEDESFDVVWACESVCHAQDKLDFIKEVFRLLRVGGRLILSDFFLNKDKQNDPHNWIRKWSDLWGVPNLVSADHFMAQCDQAGFSKTESFDYTKNIRSSAKRLYWAALLGAIPSEIYNLLHPGVSKYAKRHYRSGYYQYKALQKGLWKYNIILASK